MDDKLSRRDLLQNAAALSTLAVFGAAACSKPQVALSCMDTTGLAPADAALRTSPAVNYADYSTEPGKSCTKCQQFNPAAPNTCGTCKVLKGPVNPNGYCKLFAAKPA
jgi:hypothetical protein